MSGPPEIIAVIPARGGSKSVPRKNIRPLLGKPLLAYAIEEARKSRHISRIVLSTDDEEIAEVGRTYGADVPFLRPPELAGDSVTDLPVFCHCLRTLGEHMGCVPDVVVHLRPTAPLRTVEHIDAGVELLLGNPTADSVRSVCEAGQHPLKTWAIRDGVLLPFIPVGLMGIPEPYNQPRQQLPVAYVQNGSVDVVRSSVILGDGSMTGKVVMPLVMDPMESVNIDSEVDWQLAEILMQQRVERQKRDV